MQLPTADLLALLTLPPHGAASHCASGLHDVPELRLGSAACFRCATRGDCLQGVEGRVDHSAGDTDLDVCKQGEAVNTFTSPCASVEAVQENSQGITSSQSLAFPSKPLMTMCMFPYSSLSSVGAFGSSKSVASIVALGISKNGKSSK